MSYESMKRAAEIAEKQLHQLQSNTVVDISDDYLKYSILFFINSLVCAHFALDAGRL